jgi:protoporphyrin/coproporphyrin ferrochelatase
MSVRTGILLINLGTPDSPSVSHVRSYLSQFLNDPRVIDIPWIARKLLVNGIIVPFRSSKSSKIYKKLWTSKGSPLLIHSERAATLLQEAIGGAAEVHLAMRYKNPSIPQVLEAMKKRNYQRIVIIPMFPQYASASTGSAFEEVMRIVSQWWVIPDLRFVSQYFDHPDYIKAFVERGKQYDLSQFDHVLFSYHGLPQRHLDKVYNNGVCDDKDCDREVTDENLFCYKATSYATTRLIASALNLSPDKYTVCFQSRLNDKWVKPYSDDVVRECGRKGMKRLLVFSPAFTADCLETIVEIGDEYQEIFHAAGGEKVQLVESLNDHPLWIACLKDLALNPRG